MVQKGAGHIPGGGDEITKGEHRMIPKETKCKFCGRPVLFVPGPRGLLCVEASLTPYRFRRASESSDDMVTLYTNSGTPLPVIECEEDEMCGAAHKFHFCPNKKRERKTK